MATEVKIQGLGEFARRGFTLEHPDDDEVVLMHEGERVASFIQTGVTEESLQNECAKHLVMKHGSDGCLWEEQKGD